MAEVQEWPAGVPYAFERFGYREEVGDQLERDDFGSKRTARHAARAVLTGTLFLTGAERRLLEAFYVRTLGGGALPFRLPRPNTLTPATDRITVVFSRTLDITAAGPDEYEARMTLVLDE